MRQAMHLIILCLYLMSVPAVLRADELRDALRNFAQSELSPWGNDAQLIEALRRSNRDNGLLSAEALAALDVQWKLEIGYPNAPLMQQVLGHPLAQRLRIWLERYGGTVTEVIVMNRQGLGVAISHVTSDLWHGDEQKFMDLARVGVGALFLGEMRFDQSSQLYQADIGMPVFDPVRDVLIGAIVVGVSVDQLM